MAHNWRNWEMSDPKAPKCMDNPALAGVPGKPRCQHCKTVLADGCCVDPECPGRQQEEQQQPLLDESDGESWEEGNSTCQEAVAREGTEHPDDAPPDEAIGQQRGDEPPIAAADAAPDRLVQRPTGWQRIA